MDTNDLPPILLDYSPRGAEFKAEVIDGFARVCDMIVDRIPWLKEENGVFSGKLRRTDEIVVLNDETLALPEKRKTISGMCVGDFWEIMNVADLYFHHNRDKAKPKLLRVHTTHFKAEFWNVHHAVTFMFDMEGRWTDWEKDYEKNLEWRKNIKTHAEALNEQQPRNP